jgi:hypothetical protein
MAGAPPPEQSGSVTIASPSNGTVTTPPAPPPAQQTQTFTMDDLNKAREEARQQEKDKLYGRLSSIEGELNVFKERDAELAREREEAVAREAALRKQQEEAEMSAKDLLTNRETEWNQRFDSMKSDFDARMAQMEEERKLQEALLEKERNYQELQAYITVRMQEEADNIMPELRDYVSGGTKEEIEASIASAREKTAAIVASVVQAQQGRPRSTSITAPSMPSIENQLGQQTMTVADLRNMSMKDYEQNRQALLQAASRNRKASY